MHPQPAIIVHPTQYWDDLPDQPPAVEEKHTLCVDEHLVRVSQAHEKSRYKTPSVMVRDWEVDQMRIKPATVVHVTPGYRKWTSFANIVVRPTTLSEDGLDLDFMVNCNAGHMCDPHDLVPVFLEAVDGKEKIRFMVVLLQPQWPLTAYRVQVHYSLDQIATILRVKLPNESPATMIVAAIRDKYSEIGLLTQWLAEKEGRPSANSPNHESGGLLQKGGSGKVQLTPITLTDLEASERYRNTEWNMGELMGPGRPVYHLHSDLLAAGEEMSTTLEAESEYLTDEVTLTEIVQKLTTLAKEPARWAEFGLISVKGSTKIYTDEYFDVPNYTLLRNSIVLRRRSVLSNDPDSCYLFTCKGRSVTDASGKEVLRLAGQARLNRNAATGADKVELLCNFLADQSADNAVARVLHDALGPQKTLFTNGKGRTIKVMTVDSTRHKFALKLKDGTVIEFSGDDATGAMFSDVKARCFSFEFGVGHPGLDAASTTTTSMSTASVSGVQALIAQFDTKVGKSVVRPYHVPADLDNRQLFEKSDYEGYKKLRDDLIVKLFKLDVKKLVRGGNKARTLAIQAGLWED